jgi:hypothetical protein
LRDCTHSRVHVRADAPVRVGDQTHAYARVRGNGTRAEETATSARHPQVRGDSGSRGGEHPVLTYGDYTNLIGYMGFTRSSVHLR